MRNSKCFANINKQEINSIYKYNNIVLLTINIKYPIISTFPNSKAGERINSQIKMQVNEYLKYSLNTLYKQAMDTYKNSLKNDFPFHSFEAYMEYVITYNANGFLSLYVDKYEFTGGAHGSTIRSSNTWNLCTGENIYLSYFFNPYTDYTKFVKDKILTLASEIAKGNPLIYFENYKYLIVKNFNPQSFYLTPEGITIYYQQYEIAPYSTGIVEFTIPYIKSSTLQF